jgi:effector-binding domain-containing protein
MGDAVTAQRKDLADAAVAAGFTPIGLSRFVLMADPAQGPKWTFRVLVPIAQQPTADDLAGGPVKIVELPATRVAYTFHVGPAASMGDSFGRLTGWMKAQNLEIGGPPTVIASGPPPAADAPFIAEIQLPVK